MCSVSWRPIVSIGCSDGVGSWNTIAMRLPWICRREPPTQREQVLPVEDSTVAGLAGTCGGQDAHQRERRHRLAAAALAREAEDLAPVDGEGSTSSTIVTGAAPCPTVTPRSRTSSMALSGVAVRSRLARPRR